jgi:DNA helicase TIP49 (TBP-interacting protein)
MEANVTTRNAVKPSGPVVKRKVIKRELTLADVRAAAKAGDEAFERYVATGKVTSR